VNLFWVFAASRRFTEAICNFTASCPAVFESMRPSITACAILLMARWMLLKSLSWAGNRSARRDSRRRRFVSACSACL
jgi:hypothetical protein